MRWVILILMMMCIPISFAQEKNMDNVQLQKATFAGGCFWCMQPFLERLKGVKSVTVGYTGGHTKNPSYEEVSLGDTGHAEAVQVVFDPAVVTYEKILNLFLHNIDPTQVNGQFYDHGSQYRTAVFYHDEAQKKTAEKALKVLGDSGKFDEPIATQVVPASEFYPAEAYHQDYYKKSPERYEAYHHASGRDEFILRTWGRKMHE